MARITILPEANVCEPRNLYSFAHRILGSLRGWLYAVSKFVYGQQLIRPGASYVAN